MSQGPLQKRFDPPSPPSPSKRKARLFTLQTLAENVGAFCLIASAGMALLLAGLAFNGAGEWQYVPTIVKVLAGCIAVGFTLIFIAQYDSLGNGWLGILVSVLLINCPLLFTFLGTKLHFETKSSMHLLLYNTLPPIGAYLLIVSILQLVTANLYCVMHGRQLVASLFEPAEAKPGEKRQTSHIPKCWEMYSCPVVARERCPNFIDKVTCWQRRRGCLCDHRLAQTLFVADPSLSSAPDSPYSSNIGANMDAATYAAKMRMEKPRPWSERRAFCHNCALFLEHQGIKYRRLNWIFLPISILLVLLFQPLYHIGYEIGAEYLDDIAHRIMAAERMPSGFSGAVTLVGSPYEHILLVVLALLLATYVIEFTDRCLLEWKL